MKPIYLLASLLLLVSFPSVAAESSLRLGVAGVSHAHLGEVTRRISRPDFVVVGVWERDDALRERNGLTGRVDSKLFYADLDKMLDETKPEAVVAYGSIFDHLAVVEACAPRGIHVMVEKPLAVSTAHSERMAYLARKHNIHLLTNYETTWYATNHKAYKLVDQGAIGSIVRMNIFDGHDGPIEIGCGREFTDWLTDPVQNGGGAVIDFGCYGANLSTWMMKGEKPLKVYAVLKQLKPQIYPKVDDDATIILEYPSATVEIMASWNWPVSRKDMHIYGQQGMIFQDTANHMRLSGKDGKFEPVTPPRLESPYNDSFRYLKAVVRGDIQVAPEDLSALENNLTVVEILQAAIRSSQSGCAIEL